MEYIIVRDQQEIILGPITWRPRFIQREFEYLEINCQLPLNDPNGYLDLLDKSTNERIGVEIFPVIIQTPPHDPRIHGLGGPYYTYDNNTAYGEYTVHEKSISEIQGKLKEIATTLRYEREISGTTIELKGLTIPLDTSRESRSRYLELLNSIGSRTIDFKIPGSFISVNFIDLKAIVDKIFSHVQTQFTWESSIHSAIDTAQTVDELKNILAESLRQVPNATDLAS